MVFEQPVWFYGLLPIAALLSITLWRSRRMLGPVKRTALLLLRLAMFALLIAALAGPIETSQQPGAQQIHILLDLSHSVADDTLNAVDAELQRFAASLGDKPSTRISLTVFAGGAQEVIAPTSSGSFKQKLAPAIAWREACTSASATRFPLDPHQSDPQFALQWIYNRVASADDPLTKHHVLLITDGLLDFSDCRRSVELLRRANCDFTARLITPPAGTCEAVLREIRMPDALPMGSVFRPQLEAVISAPATASFVMRLKPAMGELREIIRQDVKLDAGLNTIPFDPLSLDEGVYTVDAEIQCAGDLHSEDNRAFATLEITGKQRLLLIEGNPDEMRNIENAVGAAGIAYDKISPLEITGELKQLAPYYCVIAAGLPADYFDQREVDAFKTYVEDLGGGLIVFGGGGFDIKHDGPPAGGLPVNQLLPVVLENLPKPDMPEAPDPLQLPDAHTHNNHDNPSTPDLAPDPHGPVKKIIYTPSVTLLLVIDRSGSMAVDEKLEMAKEAAIATCDTLDENDYIGVLAFSGDYHWVQRVTSAKNKESVQYSISRLAAGGGTVLAPALVEGYKNIIEKDTNIRHMIVLSDGEVQQADFEKLVTEMAKQKVTVSTVFIGKDDGAKQMALIAKWGQGNYYATNNFDEIPQIFSDDVKRRVESYANDHEVKPEIVDNPRKTDPKEIIKDDPPKKPDPNPGDDPDGKNKPPVKPEQRRMDVLLNQFSPCIKELRTDKLPGLKSINRSTVAQRLESLVIFKSADGAPVLAERPLGLGRVLFFASDINRFGAEFAAWDQFPEWITRMIDHAWKRASMSDIQFDNTVAVDSKRAEIRFETFDLRGAPLDNLANRLLRLGPDGNDMEIPVETLGPGFYRASVSFDSFGEDATLLLTQQAGGQNVNTRVMRLRSGGSGEIALARPDSAELSASARHAGWAVVDNLTGSLSAANPPLPVSRSFDYLFLLGALVLIPLEIALRRLLN